MRIPSGPLAAALCIVAVSLAGCEGDKVEEACGPVLAAPASSPGSLWPDTIRETVLLTDCPGEVDGPPPGSRSVRVRWAGDALDAWTREALDGTVRLTGPEIPREQGEATQLLVVLTPGGATEVRLLPFVRARQSEEDQRRNRTLVVGLDRDAPPGRPVTIRVDLTDAVLDNWGDSVARRRFIEHLELSLPGADPEAVQLREVVLAGQGLVYEDAPAGVRRVEVAGRSRPTWYVNPGAAVRHRVRVPAGAPELRWHDAAHHPGSPRSLRVTDGEKATVIWESAGGGEDWSLETISLEPWAGRVVTLEMGAGAAGAGVVFFGEPRISVDQGAAPAGIILYMIDNIRADAVGVVASGIPWPEGTAPELVTRSLTPTLDGLGSFGTVFTRAISASPWTKPAIPTLLTGLYPGVHGVGAGSYSDRLPATVPLVQESFRRAGWRTASFSASPLGSSLSSLDRGFGMAAPPRRWRGEVGGLLHPSAGQLHRELLDWIAEEPGRPFFAYVHTLEVHSYKNAIYRERAGEGIDGYGRAVAEADRELGALIAELRAAGLHQGLLLAVVSDHGESFGSHGARGHGGSLYQSELHIPFMVAGPALASAPDTASGAVIDDPVSLADVAPTLLDLAGLPALPAGGGRSLAAYILKGQAEGGARAPEFVAASLMRNHWHPSRPRQHALITRDLRKILREEGVRDLFFDLEADPAEGVPLEEAKDLVRMMDQWLNDQRSAAAEFQRSHGAATGGILDAGEAERLRSLGYLE